MIEDPRYAEIFRKRLHSGTLAPNLEVMAWAYAYGRPLEQVEHSLIGGGKFIFAWQHAPDLPAPPQALLSTGAGPV